jgi:hypothetical protein
MPRPGRVSATSCAAARYTPPMRRRPTARRPGSRRKTGSITPRRVETRALCALAPTERRIGRYRCRRKQHRRTCRANRRVNVGRQRDGKHGTEDLTEEPLERGRSGTPDDRNPSCCGSQAYWKATAGNRGDASGPPRSKAARDRASISDRSAANNRGRKSACGQQVFSCEPRCFDLFKFRISSWTEGPRSLWRHC